MSRRDDHQRAQEIAASGTPADGAGLAFLADHLAACPSCAAAASDIERGRDGLGFAFTATPPVLVALAQRRVRAHALHLHEEQVRRRGLALSLALAAGLTVATGLSLWRLASLVTLPATPWMLMASLAGLWFLPGLLAAAVLGGIARRSALTQ